MSNTYARARNSVVLLDLSDEGRMRVAGPDCEDALNAIFSVDLRRINPYAGAVGMFLREDASLVAIASVFKGDDEFFIFTEESTRQSLLGHLHDRLSQRGIVIEDLHPSHGILSVLGPQARDITARIVGDDILGIPYLGFDEHGQPGAKVFRLGFTGDFEYRFLLPRDDLPGLTATFQNVDDGIPLGDRSVLATLMLEVRSLLFEDVPSRGVLDAGLHWMVHFRKPGLLAGEILNTRKLKLDQRGLMIALADPGKAASGDALTIEGERVGFVVRVIHSGLLEQDFALAYVDAHFGWVGVPFEVSGSHGSTTAKGVSAPLFATKTIRGLI